MAPGADFRSLPFLVIKQDKCAKSTNKPAQSARNTEINSVISAPGRRPSTAECDAMTVAAPDQTPLLRGFVSARQP